MGKKGKDKLAKMSEEERARYLQMRADIEEEARRRKMQLLSLYMKNKLKREDAFCRLNMAKINQEWRSILRHVKCEELQNEMLEVERFCKEQLERKSRTIDRLLNEFDLAEDMYMTLQQSHMEVVVSMIGTQQQRAQFFREQYESEKSTVLRECQEDFLDFRRLHDQAQEELECVKYHLEDGAIKQLDEHHERFLLHLDDVQSKMQLRLEEITRSGEAKLEKLWQDYQNVLDAYVSNTESFYAEYVDLKARDEESTAQISDHCHEIERATDQLAHLKIVAMNAEEKMEVQQSYLQKVRNDLGSRFGELKKQVEQEMLTDRTRFNTLSVESHHSLKSMGNILNRGNTLMQLAAVCRKFETEREHLQPLGLPPLPKQMFDKNAQDLTTTPEGCKGLGNWMYMENFWKRVNNAAIDVVCLTQQKRTLEEENTQLKRELQDYLINLNISNGSTWHINDYLVKRPRSMYVNRVTQVGMNPKIRHSASGRPIFPRTTTGYVEANFSNAVRSHQLTKGKRNLAKVVSIVNW